MKDFMRGLTAGIQSTQNGNSGLITGMTSGYNAVKDNSAYQKGIEQIQGGDWESGVNTIAERNPEVALGLAQYKQKQDDAMNMAQMKIAADMQNRNTLTPYQQEMLALKRQQLAQNGGFGVNNIGSLPEGVSLTGNKAYDSVILKNAAERDINYQKALDEQSSFENTSNRLEELLPKAKLDTIAQRYTPTMMFDSDVQEARQEIRNILGGLRLDQMQYLKGAISDKEQAFLSDVVSGDITKYTPSEIKGTLNSIRRKMGDEVKRYAPKTAQPQGNSQSVSEGTIVEDANGNRLILRGGQWQQM